MSEISTTTRLINIHSSSGEWGLSEDGTRALVQAEGLAGQKRMLLLDVDSGNVQREFLDAANDFIVSLPTAVDQVPGPLTVFIEGQAAFVIERNTDREKVALLISSPGGVVKC